MESFRTRRSFARNITLLGCALPVLGSCAHAFAASGQRRIGFVIGDGYPQLTAAFKEELRRLGYIEGENLVVETRLTRPDRSDLVPKVAELAGMELELIVAAALPIAVAVRNANPAMRMVIATCPGMISNGFAKSIEHPGGNVTGMDELPPGLTAKRLTLLKTAAPNVSRIALLSTTGGRGGHEAQLADAQKAAVELGVSVKPYLASSLNEIESALAMIVDEKMNGLVSFQGGLSLVNRQLIVDFAASHRLAGIYQATLFAEAGGLMSWAPDLVDQFREAAGYADEILKGANPGDLPIRYPPRYYLTINAGAAERLGLLLPQTLLSSADRILQ